jgi:hypothetical protein
MDWTLADIRSLVRDLTGKPSTQQVADAVLNAKINHFWRNEFPSLVVGTDFLFAHTYTMVASVGTIDIELDHTALEEPFYVDDPAGGDEERVWVTFDRLLFYHNYHPTDTTEGRPIAVLVDARQLVVRPIPDAAYLLELMVRGVPQEFTLDADAPDDPSWGYIIALGTAINIKVEDGDLEGAQELVPLLRSKISIALTKDELMHLEKRAYPSF